MDNMFCNAISGPTANAKRLTKNEARLRPLQQHNRQNENEQQNQKRRLSRKKRK